MNVRAMELDAQEAEDRREADEQALVLFMPLRCRQILDAGTALSEEELEALWTQLQHIAARVGEGAPTDGGPVSHGPELDDRLPLAQPDRRHVGFGGLLRRGLRALRSLLTGLSRVPRERAPDEPVEARAVATGAVDDSGGVTALVAGAAVLVVMHEDWLSTHPERRRWCLDQLQSVVLNPPPSDRFDSPESVATFTWDCFAAEALPVLLAREPANKELRRLVARLVLAPHYVAVQILFRRCADHRSALGADFGRLRRFLFEAAHMRNRMTFVGRVHGAREMLTEEQVRRFGEDIDRWVSERITAFVDSRLPETCQASWRDLDAPERFKAVDEKRKQWHRTYYLDLRLLRAGHAWMPIPDRAGSVDERQEWLLFWKEAMQFVLERARDSRSDHRHPYEDEQWVLDGAAAVVQYMEPNEQPQDLWRPLLDLPAEAHHWVEDFLQSFHRHGLRQDPTPSRFAATRQSMIEYVLGNDGSSETEAKWRYYEDVWLALVGIDSFTQPCWGERHRELVAASRPLFDQWLRQVRGYGRHLAAFARWLESAAASAIRLPALVWLEQALLAEAADRMYEREAAIDPVASLLGAIWRQEESTLRQDEVAFKAFRRLLQWLADEQSEIALCLTWQIGGL